MKNKNNFSNNSIFFILQINRGSAWYDFAPKSFKQTSDNSKTELFNKNSVVDFIVDEIFNKLGNKCKIQNYSIFLFLPSVKEDSSPIHPNAAFTFLKLIFHEKEQIQGRKEKCTTKKLLEGCEQF